MKWGINVRYKKQVALLLVFFLIITISFLTMFGKSSLGENIEVSASVLSNKKIGWGIKRNDNHLQPDLGRENKRYLDEVEGIAMGSNEKKYVYLTFDEGYEAGYTFQILDVLKKTDVKAAFFITAHYLNSKSDLVKRMIDEGHIVGNHTVNHYSMPSLDDEKLKEEIMKLHASLHEKFGYEMKYFRPPMGEYSQRTLALTKNLGYTTVMWSFAYDDWDVNKQRKSRIW